jgi:tetratricopeptide (TPR) repeat protein
MEDKIEVTERQSESQVLAMKSYVDKFYDEIDSKVKFYRRTNEILRDARKKANDAIPTSEKLVIGLNELKVNMAQTEERMLAINAWLLAPAGTANTLQNQILENRRELSRLNDSYQKMTVYRDNGLLKLNGQKGQLAQAEKEFKETCVKEKESLKGLLDSIDFFDEFPVEVHQRVFEQSRQWFATEPDFFLAYLLNSVAAVHLGEFKVPETNLAEMRRQAGLISSADQAARAIALKRFETVAITIVGLSEYKQQRANDASETMKDVFRTEQDMVEAWLLRGKIGLSKKGQPDGMNFFKKAVNLDRQSPRVYRIALDALVAQDEFPESTVRGLLDNLIKRAGPTDERAMLTAATAYHKLGDSDNAMKYLDKVKVPYLMDLANKLRESISAE